jgi:hypothetical protein
MGAHSRLRQRPAISIAWEHRAEVRGFLICCVALDVDLGDIPVKIAALDDLMRMKRAADPPSILATHVGAMNEQRP